MNQSDSTNTATVRESPADTEDSSPPKQAAVSRRRSRSPASRPEPEAKAGSKIQSTPELDLSAPAYYLNRELTWLEFCKRVLHEAEDERTPLLEKVKFLSIVSSNLDEFFMKRIGGLMQQVGAGIHTMTIDGRTPRQQIEESYEIVADIESRQDRLLGEITKELVKHDIRLLSYEHLTEPQKAELRTHYFENIFPLVTPQAMDPAHPFPFISNLSLNLLVTLRYPDSDEPLRARVKVPIGAGVPRFIKVAGSNGFVPLEQVMSENLDLLFPKMIIDACELFHVTRNANTDPDQEHADDLLASIESAIRSRRFAPIVRALVQRDMEPFRRGLLAAELGLDETANVVPVSGMMRMRDLMEVASLDIPELHHPPYQTAEHASIRAAPNLFYVIRDSGPLLLQHPYESFTLSVERFVRDASRDPKVGAIKMTLYRTSSDTKILDYLIDAARNGKQVAVVVELQARFDETANIRWASRLEAAGIHVTYGVIGLKTHCKLILVVRQDYSGLRRYVHIGTGNYHAGTARLYSDLGLLTCDEALCADVTELFNYLTTGYTPKRNYKKLLPAPKLLKRTLQEKIAREIEQHTPETPGHIQFKVNALEDADITRALYEASQAGVKVDLIVRDTCRLRPGVPGLSENVRVISIVGQFLEHARVYYFKNQGAEEYYIGSADAMMRNLEHRVEVLAPVEGATLQSEVRQMLDLQLDDHRSAWEMQSDGSYRQRVPRSAEDLSSQERLTQLAAKRHKASRRLKLRKPKIISRRNVPGSYGNR